ncbi:TonB-dependent receptor family protein [Gilvimarinus agarilyticus]|uniref:TonB-dependent receptor family protein n=1 Tax=Gilvimarinus agarilyticus TaxID=679259 RepID=UPI0012F912A2|nr:TonB-dependent receptor [Gilvimarinus agarilyticus]
MICNAPCKAGSSFVLLLAGICPSVFAVDAGAEPASRLQETVVVTANREPGRWYDAAAAVDVVAVSEQIPGFRFDSAELLAGLPGVQADSRANFAQDTRITLRGFGARSAFGVRGINLRIDGVPLTMPDGQSQTSSIALGAIDRVEVLRGPMASLYGNAAGGTIAFYSARPEESELTATLAGGDAEQRRYQLQGQWAGERAGARVLLSQFSTDGFREHSSAERNQLAGQWYYQTESEVDLLARVDISRDPETLDPQGLTYDQWQEDETQVHPVATIFDPRKSIEHAQTSLGARQQTAWGGWQASGWVGEREIEQYLSFPGDDENGSGAVIDLHREFSGANLRLARQLATLELAAGVELAQMRDQRQGFVNAQGELGELKRDEVGEVQSRDVYTSLQWQPSARWSWQAGARYNSVRFDVADNYIQGTNPDDSGSLRFSEPSLSLGGSYGEGPWRLFASLGSGFETPTLTEMAYRNEGTGLNTDLQPSRNRQAEFGWRIEAQTLNASIVSFVVHSQDELVVDQSSGGRTTYRNGADTEREGLEGQLSWQLASQWHWRLGGTLMRAEYSAGPYAGLRLPGVARENLYSQVDWQARSIPLQLSLATQYRGDVASSDDNSEIVPGALTWDLAARSQRAWGATLVSLWAKLNNVTDKKYVGSVIVNQSRGRTIEPAPGRQLDVGVEVSYRW